MLTSASNPAARAAVRAASAAAPVVTCAALCALAFASGCTAEARQQGAGPQAGAPATSAQATSSEDWRTAEAPVLRNHVQLTFADRFVKAGESYFSPDDKRIIFQAIEVPKDGSDPGEHYAMFVADLTRDGHGRVTGLANIRRISPPGSANTCGWFHPTDPDVVIFGSTITPPSDREAPGYQRGTGRYRWQFPPEMRIVKVNLSRADGTPESLTTVVGDGNAYVAEGSLSRDGRTLLYTQVDPQTQGDLWVLDLPTGKTTRIVHAPGYDGGPFFSPDDRSIVYRSDRDENNLLQVYVADLVRDAQGRVTGVVNERPLTANEHVNWCPFFHPDGDHVVYATSQVGHSNYEVFMRSARDPSTMARITMGSGADVLPVFNQDGTLMMWTAQRGPEPGPRKSSQIWVADFDLSAARQRMEPDPQGASASSSGRAP